MRSKDIYCNTAQFPVKYAIRETPVNFRDAWGLENLDKKAFDDAVDMNRDFTTEGMGCDLYGTTLLDDLGKTPDDWLDPAGAKVGENDQGLPNYIDSYADELEDTPSPGVNVVMMETGHPDEHMVIIYVDENDGSITMTHYTNGATETVTYTDQADFEGDGWVYDEFHYLSVE